MRIFYFTSLIFVTLSSLFGLYVYIYKKKSINLNQIMNLFWINLFFRSFDLLSTAFFTSRLGIESEGNLIARFLMNTFGIWGGLFATTLVFIPLTFLLFVTMNYFIKDYKGAWETFKLMMILIGITIPIYNVMGSI